MKGRKRGCPVNIRNWIIMVKDAAAPDEDFTRVYGLDSMTRSVESETEDGSAETDVWAEPHVTKRNGSLSLEGKPIIDAATGAKDEGQALLNEFALLSGCDADITVKMIDPYGHAAKADYIVSSAEESSDSSGATISWELEQVGEAEKLPYVQVQSIALHDQSSPVAETVNMNAGDPAKLITVKFTPDTSSNQRFRVSNNKRNVVNVGSITEKGFSITPVGPGTGKITVTSVNGAKTASFSVKVT